MAAIGFHKRTLVPASITQVKTCNSWGSLIVPPAAADKVGLAIGTLAQLPLNALRHPAENGTCGWYIWGGEWQDSPDFFQPVHVEHLEDYVPNLIPYLALAPGWRVLVAPGQVDVWYDPGLLST